MFKIVNPTFGSDFEFFVKKDNKIVPGLMIEGTKFEPAPIGEHCYIQRDGVAGECNIPPVNNKKDWLNRINYCFDKSKEILAKQGLTISPQSSNVFEKKDLDIGDLRTLFCSHSFDAYNKGAKREANADGCNLRTCGFHVHLGFNKIDPDTNNLITMEDVCNFTHYCDMYLGIPSVLLDNDKKRRSLYGLPGDFRFKTIKGPDKGEINLFEYRSLGSNLMRSDKLIGWVYDNLNRAVEAYNNQEPLIPLKAMYHAILKSEVEAANKFIQQYEIPVVKC